MVDALAIASYGVRETASAPWLKTLDLTAARCDGCSYTLGRGASLFLLQVRRQDEEDFVISQSSPSFQPTPDGLTRTGAGAIVMGRLTHDYTRFSARSDEMICSIWPWMRPLLATTCRPRVWCGFPS